MKRVLLLVSTFMPSSSICVAFSFLPNDNSISKGSKSYNNMELTLSPGSTRCDLVHQNVESTQQQAISPRWLSTMTILSTTLLLQPLSPIRVCAIPNDGLPSVRNIFHKSYEIISNERISNASTRNFGVATVIAVIAIEGSRQRIERFSRFSRC
mmetsp:Transcript_11460/g.22194  ORF Transcript_11460/g.22194 Transcript_11460/m.22194 type:complete len:154 (-) Transcript_11460:283-744(-)